MTFFSRTQSPEVTRQPHSAVSADASLYSSPMQSAAGTFLFSRDSAMSNASRGDYPSAVSPVLTIADLCTDLATRAGVAPFPIRSACIHAIATALYSGRGATLQIDISANFSSKEKAWVQCSVKYYMSTLAFLSEPDDAEKKISAFLHEAGQKDDVSYESDLDEIKYICGAERTVGRKEFFLKKIMKTYALTRPKKPSHEISPEFHSYIESLNDYNSALFVRIDRFAKKKEIVISEERGAIDEIRSIMSRYGYEFHTNERCGEASFSFWSTDLGTFEKNGFDAIMGELEQVIHANR